MSHSSRQPILVAEDNDQDFEVIAEVLDGMSCAFPIRRVVTGEQCLELLEREDPIHPAFMMLDLNMPGLDGRDVLNAIRGNKTISRFPIVILTTSSSPTDLQSCYEGGANSYHLKPVEAPKFRQVVQTILTFWCEAVELPQIHDVAKEQRKNG